MQTPTYPGRVDAALELIAEQARHRGGEADIMRVWPLIELLIRATADSAYAEGLANGFHSRSGCQGGGVGRNPDVRKASM